MRKGEQNIERPGREEGARAVAGGQMVLEEAQGDMVAT